MLAKNGLITSWIAQPLQAALPIQTIKKRNPLGKVVDIAGNRGLKMPINSVLWAIITRRDDQTATIPATKQRIIPIFTMMREAASWGKINCSLCEMICFGDNKEKT